MNFGWIDPALLRDFQAEGTDAHRLCTSQDGWVERFGSDVLISFKTVLARQQLLENVQTWTPSCGIQVRRVFARFISRKDEQREPPRLIIGDPSESLRTIATEWHLKFGIDFGTGYSPGLFLDQRENRRYVRHIAPKHLLNCFAYTCSFSVCAACSAHGKRAGVSKTVQQVLWCDVTHVAAILSLVQKKTRRIACAEIDAKLQMPFGGNGPQTLARIANNQTRRFTLFVLSRDKSREYSSNLNSARGCPGLHVL